MSKDVWITGVGSVTSISGHQSDLPSALRSGRSGICEAFSTGKLRSSLGARVPLDSIRGEARHEGLDLELDRCLLLALHAARQALGACPLEDPIALCVGLAGAEMARTRRGYEEALSEGISNPALLLRTAGSVAASLSLRLGLKRPFVEVHQNACAAGMTAVGSAADLIRHGHVERALAGGAEMLDYGIHAGFDSIRALSSKRCAPFDERRDGTVLGEGAAFVLLESERAANRRGATPMARLAGYGMSNDAFHRTRPDPSGLGQASAMNAALADAGVHPDTIDVIYAHGTGTPANDAVELKAIETVLTERAREVPIASVKGATGHTIAASGALNIVLAVLTLNEGVFAGTAGLQEPIADYAHWNLRRTASDVEARTALVNAFAFGGNNSSAVVTAL